MDIYTWIAVVMMAIALEFVASAYIYYQSEDLLFMTFMCVLAAGCVFAALLVATIDRKPAPCEDQRIKVNDVWYVPEDCLEVQNAD